MSQAEARAHSRRSARLAAYRVPGCMGDLWRRLGIPGESRESFAILAREKAIPADLGERLQRMVGFSNVAVHQYRDLDIEIVETVITRHLDDLLEFAQQIRAQLGSESRTDNG